MKRLKIYSFNTSLPYKIRNKVSKGIMKLQGRDVEKEVESYIAEAMRFYLLATELKDKIRSGWDNEHWRVNSERLESIGEHTFGTGILAISLDAQFDLGVNIGKVLKMLLLHEIGEVLIGDITPYDNITREQKIELEHQAMKEVIGDLCTSDEIYELLLEFDEHKTKESRLAYYCDKMDADIRSKVYQDRGMHRPLGEQSSKITMNPNNKALIDSGEVKTAFELWAHNDEPIYKENELFQKILQYIKKTNTNIRKNAS